MGVRFISLCALTAASACVTPFSGSDVQIDFSASTQIAGGPAANQPPGNTYYSLYAVQKGTDDTGTVVANYLFEVQRFEIKRLIDLGSPCFIDLADARFPGLHVTEFANKVEEQTGIADPMNPPSGASPTDITDVLDAQTRVAKLENLQDMVKVVTDSSNVLYGASETSCIEDVPGVDQSKFPPPRCTGDQSNKLRLTLCEAFWKSNPEFYEGSDKVFTLPLAGHFRGMVEGQNPNNGSFIGGSEFFVDTVLTDPSSYLVTWQYKDLDGDGMPDFPVGTPAEDKPFGHTYMVGTPVRAARGVINVPLANRNDPSISAEMAIFSDLANDGTHF